MPLDEAFALTEMVQDTFEDSSVSETHGRQEGSAYDGHFRCTCYHPLFPLNQFADLQRAMLRRGNHASAKSWRDCHITSGLTRGVLGVGSSPWLGLVNYFHLMDLLG